MKLIIDGYNVIFAERNLPSSPHTLEYARNELIWLLSYYNLKKSYQIIVVFDGKTQPFNRIGNRQHCIPHPTQINRDRPSARIEIRFSETDSSADDMIKDLVPDCPALNRRNTKRQTNDMQVVTSDRQLARSINKSGVPIVSAKQFLNELRTTFQVDGDVDEPSKPSGLSETDVNKWMKVFGLDKD